MTSHSSIPLPANTYFQGIYEISQTFSKTYRNYPVISKHGRDVVYFQSHALCVFQLFVRTFHAILNSSLFLKYVLRRFRMRSKNVCMGANSSKHSHTSRRFHSSITSTDLTYPLAEVSPCSSLSMSDFQINSCRALNRISCGMASVTQLGSTLYPISFLSSGRTR